MSARDIAVIILLLFLAAFAVAYFVVGPGRRRGPKPAGDIPLAQRPYHSDEELESTGLERVMSWGLALTLFSAIFIPVYWVLEPTRIDNQQEEFFQQDVEMGRLEFADRCATCHGSNAGGGATSFQLPSGESIQWPVPALDNIVARYDDNDNVTDIEEFMTQTIQRGRPGTPMPAWGAMFGGGLNDQQIDAIVRYLLSIQKPVPGPTGTPTAGTQEESPEPGAETTAEPTPAEIPTAAPTGEQVAARTTGAQIFENNCARCHGFDASGRVGPGLHDVFARFGDDGTPEGEQEARTGIRFTIEQGRVVPDYTDMPAWDDRLTDSQIDALIDYLASIQGQEGAPRVQAQSQSQNQGQGEAANGEGS